MRDLAAEALKAGNYEDAAALAQLAKALADLCADHIKIDSTRARASPRSRASNLHAASISGSTERNAQSPPNVSEYPRFERHGKKLVKIGWSSRDGRAYEHRAPYEAVQQICKMFAERAGAKGLLRVDKLLPVKLDDGEELPSYQVYLVLKWLQHRGVIDRQGKDSYYVRTDDLELKRLWDNTPTK